MKVGIQIPREGLAGASRVCRWAMMRALPVSGADGAKIRVWCLHQPLEGRSVFCRAIYRPRRCRTCG